MKNPSARSRESESAQHQMSDVDLTLLRTLCFFTNHINYFSISNIHTREYLNRLLHPLATFAQTLAGRTLAGLRQFSSFLRMPSERTKVHPGPFNGGGIFSTQKGDNKDNSKHCSGTSGSFGGPSESEPLPADEAGKLFDFAVSMVSVNTVAAAVPRPAPGEAVGDDGFGQQEEPGAKTEVDTEGKGGRTDQDDDSGSDLSSNDATGKLFDYAVSMAAAASTMTPPRPQGEADRKDGPEEEQKKPREQDGPQRESGAKGGGGGDEPEDDSLRDGAGRLLDYAISMVAKGHTADAPPRPASSAERKEEGGGGEEGEREQEDSQAEEEEDKERQQEEYDESLGSTDATGKLFDYAVSMAAAASTMTPPRPQGEADRKDGPEEEQKKPREQDGPQRESGAKGGGGGDEQEDDSLRDGAGRLLDYAISMVAKGPTADVPSRPASSAERKEEGGGVRRANESKRTAKPKERKLRSGSRKNMTNLSGRFWTMRSAKPVFPQRRQIARGTSRNDSIHVDVK